MSKFIKLLLFTLIITVCCSFSVSAQINEETEIVIQQKISSRFLSCYLLKNAVYDEQKFKEISEDKNCSHLKSVNIDFTKQTLIGFRVNGDCFVRGDAKVFRDDEAKTYKIRVQKIWGGCRAAGTYTGWVVIDKIPADYKVEFSESRIDNLQFNINDSDEEKLETRGIDLKGCIQTYFTKRFVIKDEVSYLKAIRNDSSREYCLKNIENIDFNKCSDKVL